jgi:hypothetical protein
MQKIALKMLLTGLIARRGSKRINAAQRRRNQESYNSADRHWYRQKVVSDGKPEGSAASPCTKIDRRDHRSKRLAKKTDPLWLG